MPSGFGVRPPPLKILVPASRRGGFGEAFDVKTLKSGSLDLAAKVLIIAKKREPSDAGSYEYKKVKLELLLVGHLR